MERLREKLNSRRGASILLALLLLFVCCMVAASVLAAASSNAGKIRSNRVEQQKHFTLSSAIELVCGQLQEAVYEGHYEVYEWTEESTDTDGITVYESRFCCVQKSGSYDCEPLNSLFTLGTEMDKVFGLQFLQPGYESLPLYGEGELVHGIPDVHYRLTVSLPPDLAGYPHPKDSDNPGAYEVPDNVTVEVTLSHATRHITVTAWLGEGEPPDDGADMMSAELVAVGNPVLDYNPSGRSVGSSSEAIGAADATCVEKKTNPVKWKLNWIRKGVS